MSVPESLTVAVAVSGGMDSLLSLVLLQEQGHDVLAVHGRFLPGADERAEAGLAEQCDKLSIPFHVLDLRAEFARLVTNAFVAEYAAGNTPNPCALCNPRMKFGLILDRAEELGADRVATGHYARMEDYPQWGRVLKRGADPAKDQSYFLSLVPRERLSRALFPLGGLRKSDVPDELSRRGLTPPLSTESQEICFIPDDDYQAYLATSGADLPGSGPMVLSDGTEVGRHGGLWRYTQGQRRGLGVAWSEPLYVLDKNVSANQLIVGTRGELAVGGCVAGEANVLVEPDRWPDELFAQIRYRQRPHPVRCEVRGEELHIAFDEPRERPAPGQVAVVYSGDGVVLAGGRISRSRGEPLPSGHAPAKTSRT